MGEEIEVVLPTVTWDKSSETRDGFKRRVMAAVEVAVSEGESHAVMLDAAGRYVQEEIDADAFLRACGAAVVVWRDA